MIATLAITFISPDDKPTPPTEPVTDATTEAAGE